MRSFDAYYTPHWLAAEVAEALPADLQGRVLDPSVGAGSLLKAVGARFNDNAGLLGLDIDNAVVTSLRRDNRDWVVSRADLLKPASRRASRAWRLASEATAAVVMNPPFSYRGNGGAVVHFDDFVGRVAPAMHFLVAVLGDLRPTGGVFAVLPDGAIEAVRHEPLWDAIGTRYDVDRLARFKTTSFKGARVSTSLVRLRAGSGVSGTTTTPVRPERLSPSGCRCVEVIRGRVQVHKVQGIQPASPVPFLHTTNVRLGSSTLSAESHLSDEAPFLIINRIGRWRSPIVVDVGRAVLSDCLIALRPRSRASVQALSDAVTESQVYFAAEYRGTGAKYVPVSAIVRQIERLGWHPHRVQASSPVGLCCCEAAELRVCTPVDA